MTIDARIHLSHGSGQGHESLLHNVILPSLGIAENKVLEDSAVLNRPDGRLAFTTDSFVVSPLEFRGGDIGKLAACGTINDLSMMGAKPAVLSVSLIIEEGLEIELLARLLNSLRNVCEQCAVEIVCGDTKVVERGKADGLFINTAGIGYVPDGRNISVKNIKHGDSVIVSGPIGLHGITVLSQRKNLGFASGAVSDCAPLNEIVDLLLAKVPAVHALRDPTRGGCAAVLNEMAKSAGVTIKLVEETIPVPDVVAGACSYLGIDPLQVANEGRFIAILPPADAQRAVDAIRSHSLGQNAAIIGEVMRKDLFPVVLQTKIGAVRPVEMPPGELLPRIC